MAILSKSNGYNWFTWYQHNDTNVVISDVQLSELEREGADGGDYTEITPEEAEAYFNKEEHCSHVWREFGDERTAFFYVTCKKCGANGLI